MVIRKATSVPWGLMIVETGVPSNLVMSGGPAVEVLELGLGGIVSVVVVTTRSEVGTPVGTPVGGMIGAVLTVVLAVRLPAEKTAVE